MHTFIEYIISWIILVIVIVFGSAHHAIVPSIVNNGFSQGQISPKRSGPQQHWRGRLGLGPSPCRLAPHWHSESESGPAAAITVTVTAGRQYWAGLQLETSSQAAAPALGRPAGGSTGSDSDGCKLELET